MRGRGSAVADYLGAVLTVGLMMLALVALKEHRPQRRPPIDPVGEVAALVRPTPPPSRPRAPRPVRPRSWPTPPRRARPPAPVVLVPGWAVGW